MQKLFKSNNEFSLNQAVFRKDLSITNNLPLFLEHKTWKEQVQQSLNALDSARVGCVKGKSSVKLKRVIKHSIRTHADVTYQQGFFFFHKRVNTLRQEGPGTVTGDDG